MVKKYSRMLGDYWWLIGGLFLVFVLFVMPKVNLGTDLLAMHPPDTIRAGECYNDKCLTKCYAASDIRPYYCSTQCGDEREIRCDSDSDCDLDCTVDVVQPSSSNTNQPVVNSDGDVADASEISCKNDKLYKGSSVWDDCEDNGCHMVQGKAKCIIDGDDVEDKDWFKWLKEEKVGPVPIYMIILVAFLFLMMGAGGGGGFGGLRPQSGQITVGRG